jgi:hypothetical protein
VRVNRRDVVVQVRGRVLRPGTGAIDIPRDIAASVLDQALQGQPRNPTFLCTSPSRHSALGKTDAALASWWLVDAGAWRACSSATTAYDTDGNALDHCSAIDVTMSVRRVTCG